MWRLNRSRARVENDAVCGRPLHRRAAAAGPDRNHVRCLEGEKMWAWSDGPPGCAEWRRHCELKIIDDLESKPRSERTRVWNVILSAA